MKDIEWTAEIVGSQRKPQILNSYHIKENINKYNRFRLDDPLVTTQEEMWYKKM